MAFEKAAADLTTASRRASDVVLDAHPLTAYAMNAGQEVPPAVELVLTGLQLRARDTLSGAAPATVPKPEPPVVPKLALVEGPKMREVVAMRSKWTHEGQGRVVCAGQYQRCSIPESLVAHALAIGAVATVSDPRVRNLIGSSGMQVPLPSRCQAIDDTADTVEAKSNAIITSSHFEKVDRGPGYTMRVPVQSVEPAAVGARALPTEEEP